MGCDIHTYAERKTGNTYKLVKDMTPFDWRAYGMYGFLAGVRNYSDVPALAANRGLPDDVCAQVSAEYERWGCDAHSASWIDVQELADFNYDQTVEDRRVTRQTAWGLDGGCTAEPGGGAMTTYREFLGDSFFTDLDKLKASGVDRVVFWFDN